MLENMGQKLIISSDFGWVSNILIIPLYVFTSEVAVVKSHHGISVKCSRYRDTGTTDPSLV